MFFATNIGAGVGAGGAGGAGGADAVGNAELPAVLPLIELAPEL